MDMLIIQAASRGKLSDRERKYLCDLIALQAWEREKALYWRRLRAIWVLAVVVLLVAVAVAKPFH